MGSFTPYIPEVLCLSETRFTTENSQNITGFNSYHVVRERETASGGISVFVEDCYESTLIENLSFSNATIEICTVEIFLENKPLILIGIYRPHSDSVENFNSLLMDILNDTRLRNKTCILMGI